jgi:arabinose-5-phosphate isomerase
MILVHSFIDMSHIAQEVISLQITALTDLLGTLDGVMFNKAVTLLFGCEGNIIVTGMGKSGNIAAKVASTMTSTGSPAVFLHSGEALHGGLGFLRERDVVLAFSKSGETDEVLAMLYAMRYHQLPIISVTCGINSTLAKSSDVAITYSVDECCSVDMIPTTSTTIALVIGDALAMALLRRKGLKMEQFAMFHPGGQLGQIARDSVGKVEFNE